jgi:hypothetical protein
VLVSEREGRWNPFEGGEIAVPAVDVVEVEGNRDALAGSRGFLPDDI